MTRPLVWDEAARVEMRAAVAYHREISVQVGSRFLDDVERALTHISVFPESCPRVEGEVRRKNLSSFRFGVFYENLPDKVLIIAPDLTAGRIERSNHIVRNPARSAGEPEENMRVEQKAAHSQQ